MATPESRVKAKVDKLLKLFDDCWFFSPQAGPYGRSGVPDRVGVIGGRMFAVECKAGKGVLTALQSRCIADMQAAGCECFVVRDDETLKDLKNWLIGNDK